VFEAVAATEVLGMSPTVASLAFSLNAAGGLVGARLSGHHRRPGWLLASSGPAAFLTIAGSSPLWFFIGMTWWGFAFWMGVPGVLQMLAARSLGTGRAGRGRAGAPLIGGAFVDAGAVTALAATVRAGLILSGGLVIAVQEGRERLPAMRGLESRGRAP
jgi:hypothetical protein